MNFRIKVGCDEVSIKATTEAVDNIDVHPTLKIARGHVIDRVEKLIDQLRAARKAAVKVPEKGLGEAV